MLYVSLGFYALSAILAFIGFGTEVTVGNTYNTGLLQLRAGFFQFSCAFLIVATVLVCAWALREAVLLVGRELLKQPTSTPPAAAE